MDEVTIEQEIAARQEFQKAWLIAMDERDALHAQIAHLVKWNTALSTEVTELRVTLAQLRELYVDREHDLAHEFKRANDAEAELDALRALAGDLRAEVDTTKQFARDTRNELDALRSTLIEMRDYINRNDQLMASERWLLSTIEAALPGDSSK